MVCWGGWGSRCQWGMHEGDGYGSCREDPKEAALPPQPASPWVGGWWWYMDHSPLVLWAIPHPAVPPWERPGSRHRLSGKHMPGGLCRMLWPPQRLRGSAVFPGGDSLGSGCVLTVLLREAQRELRGSEESQGAGWALA